jgi:ferredoxin-NADP reductase
MSVTKRRERGRSCSPCRIGPGTVPASTLSWPPSAAPRAYVCGPTVLVESVATLLVELGHAPSRVRTERFGPTG